MLNLPFHIESPLATAIVVGVVALLFALLWWSFEKNYLFSRDVLLSYFRRRLGALEPKKAETAAKLFLAGMAVLFSVVSIFGFSVASGIIRNGEKFKPARSEQSQGLQQYLESSKGRIDVKELIRQDEAKREANK
jgi:RsiW-degrading membrane proteinase PrsW (M82 family)